MKFTSRSSVVTIESSKISIETLSSTLFFINSVFTPFKFTMAIFDFQSLEIIRDGGLNSYISIS